MRRSIRWIPGSLALLALMAGDAVRARAQFSHRVNASIPFAFEAGGRILPPGSYSITHPVAGAIQIVSRDGARFVYATAHDETSDTTFGGATLLFHRINGRYFFTGVWEPENKVGSAVWTSRAEREARRALAADGSARPAPEPVYVSARLAP
ncbi:MAG TPA: hypothetical protein VG860_12285 [Terriglobia bacterium]|jgi:hypothetical protein|nr:hypothetical protein [Terriglobia bacterium]